MHGNTYNLAQLDDRQVADLLAQIHISDGQASEDLTRAARELFGVIAEVCEVKDDVWLVTIPMPAPVEGELEIIVIPGGQRLPDPIWRPKRSMWRKAVDFLNQRTLQSQVVVVDVARW